MTLKEKIFLFSILCLSLFPDFGHSTEILETPNEVDRQAVVDNAVTQVVKTWMHTMFAPKRESKALSERLFRNSVTTLHQTVNIKRIWKTEETLNLF